MTINRNRILIFIAIAFVLASTILGRAFTAIRPDWSDAQLFMYFGTKWLEGLIPYRDIWDNKPPGIFFIIAIIFSVFPGSTLALAVMEGLFVAGGAVTVFLLCRKFGLPRYAAVISLLVAAIALNLSYYNQHGVYTEIYLVWPAALSIYFFARSLPALSFNQLLLAGFFSGIAALFKTPGLASLLAEGCLLFLMWLLWELRLRHLVRSYLALSFGLGLAWLVPLAYFFGNGALSSFLNATFLYNIDYGISSQPNWYSLPLNLVERLLPVGGPVVMAVLGTVLIMAPAISAGREYVMKMNAEDRKLYLGAVLTMLWLLFDLLGAMVGGRNYPHYYLPALASISALAGFSYWAIVQRSKVKHHIYIFEMTIISLLIGPLLLAQVMDIKQVRVQLSNPNGTSAWEKVSISLNLDKKEGDTLFVWGYQPGILFKTNMNSPSRYTSAHYLRDSPKAQADIGKIIFTDLQKRPPTFIVVAEGMTNNQRLPDRSSKTLMRMIEGCYVTMMMEGNLKVYRRAGHSQMSCLPPGV